MTQITLDVTDEQLAKFKQTVEQLGNGVCTDPVLMLTKLLQSEINSIDCYVNTVFDDGCNSIGDVFFHEAEWSQFFIENDTDEDDDDY